MPAPNSLKDVYLDEMKDLWSANNQMAGTLKKIMGRASDPKLKTMLEHAIDGIEAHSGTLKSLVAKNGGEVSPEHCKGMEGLVKEALKHAVEEAPSDGHLRDAQIIAQYQRMTHYGLAGFGTAAAYAKALGLADQEAELKRVVSDVYRGDEYATMLAEAVERAAA